MAKKFPIHPSRPERICWGCDQLCAADALACANERSPHPAELFGDDWLTWGEQQLAPVATSVAASVISKTQPDH